ncbi:uncharacterized protein [Nicotiana sylvestris]|uniref:uncharacterized protein n=1 Tax=Nicotiana sylvestris TaxID=4096 RepID=UPI00388CC1BA
MNEDPNNHLMDFEEKINTFQYNGVSQGLIKTWEDMTRKILAKYFSSAKTGKFRREIHNFCQNETKTVFEAWERFKEIVRKCQHSGIELWMQLQDFWDGFTPASHRILSNAAGGPLMKKTPEEIVIIPDELSEDANQWSSEISERRRSTVVQKVDANISVQVQLDAMAKEIRKLTFASIHNELHAACDICGRGHPTHECQATMEETRPQFQPHQSNQPGLEDLMKSFIGKIEERLDSHGIAIKELGTVLSQMQAYEKFLKEIITKEIKMEDTKVVKITEHCSTLNFDKSLCDSGASINLVPLSIYRNLENELGKIRSAPISLQLVDQTTIILEGIVEDVLVWVDKFVFPVDFIVVKIEENKEIPLILGRPFLAMGRAY